PGCSQKGASQVGRPRPKEVSPPVEEERDLVGQADSTGHEARVSNEEYPGGQEDRRPLLRQIQLARSPAGQEEDTTGGRRRDGQLQGVEQNAVQGPSGPSTQERRRHPGDGRGDRGGRDRKSVV